jgi:hypothetical protein
MTPSNTASQQNADSYIAMLAARFQLYRDAEWFWTARAGGATVLAVAGPFIAGSLPAYRIAIASLGVAFAIVSEALLRHLEVSKVRQAVLVQEQFDVEVYRLLWNRNLVGRRLMPELIVAASRRFLGDREKLRNWYPDTGNIDRLLAILLCQRLNMVWDVRQRRRFAALAVFATSGLFGAGVVAGLILRESLADYVLGILSPSISAYIIGAQISQQHWEIAASKESVEETINGLWGARMNDKSALTELDCRQVQDRIYMLRGRSPVLPDWLYQQ